MIKKSQWKKWLIVFFLMSFFTLFQVPISQYALGIAEHNPSNSINQQVTGITENIDKINETAEESDEVTNQESIEEKPVYLTIDDGPGIVSEHILDILANYDIPATFFVLEPRVRYYSDMISRMNVEGHELGVHGVTHDVKHFYSSSESVVNELNRTRYSLQELTAKEHYLARTPYGSFPYLSKEQEKAVLEEGYKIWDWNVDSRDWYFRNDRYVQYTISQLERLQQNDTIPVILIHELETTARHLPLLIDYLLTNDYKFKTLNLEEEPVRLR